MNDPVASGQAPFSVAYLGPAGTFTEEALLGEPDLAAGRPVPLASIPEVLAATSQGEVDYGFVAIENSIEGTVTVTMDTLAFDADLLIQREVVLNVRLSLLGLPGAQISDIRRVVSFPHATAQCRGFLNSNLPDARTGAADSTADAARVLSESVDRTTAAIGTSLAARVYGLDELATDIEDHPENQTRFVVVAREGVPEPTGHDKTSIVVYQRADRPGSLLAILQEFAARSINLSKLESRPTKRALGEYCFMIDLDGHVADEVVTDCLRNLKAKQADVKFLGSYPAAGEEGHELRRDADASWREADRWVQEIRSHIR
ncbi:MAG: prephenate dehydratase [Actinobacteria bacterium]|nr:MAG: prephenate dehydratase [Actinomycetota bacterium]RIK03537.1 MAG: prephenate dehydratase [Acidobacteriota bacterium]